MNNQMAVSSAMAMYQLNIDVYKCVRSMMKEILEDGHGSDLLKFPLMVG